MIRAALLFVIALAGCASGAPAPEATASGAPAPEATASEASASEPSSGASEQGAAPDAKTWCPKAYAGDSRYDKCRWRVASQGYCGGAVPTREQMVPSPRCMCDGCATDKDCPGSARGRCAEVPSIDSHCVPPARVCVPDGERCPPDNSGQAQNGVRWRHDGEGHATCFAEAPPRP